MTYQQNSEVLTSLIQQFTGEKEISSIDLSDLVAMGQVTLDSLGESAITDFAKGLLDRVYRVITGIREYTPQSNNILMDYAKYGAMLEKIYIEPTDPVNNASYELVNGGEVNPFLITLPKTNVKVFSNMDVWEIPYTITKKMLLSKFTSEEEYLTFIEYLELQIRNSFELALENQQNITKINFIAEKYNYSKQEGSEGIHVINLLTEYNTFTNASLTIDTAYTNQDFLKFCTRRMNVIKKKMEKYSRVFNLEQFARFTKSSDLRIDVQTDFAQAIQTNLESDVYHNELVQLPTYNEVAFWQGSGTDYDMISCQKIETVTSDGNEVTVNGVVAFFHDVDALGVTVWDKTTTSQYNGRGEYTNLWMKANIGSFNDLSEQAVVFIIAEDSQEV